MSKSKTLFFRVLGGVAVGVLIGLTFAPRAAQAAGFVVYGVYRPLDLGGGEPPAKDYYINMGAANGLAPGATVDIYHKLPTYDLEAQKLMTDIEFKVGTLKIIHVEQNAAVARLEKMLPTEEMPGFTPHVIMVGDSVRRR